MKKFFTLLLLALSLVSMAQESTLLRVNYNKGDKYIMSMFMKQDMAAMNMLMKMDMSIDVKDVEGDVYNTEMKIEKINMNMSQGGMNMSYDSDKGDDELDPMGKQMQMQFAPMLEMIIFAKSNNLGEVLETRIEPNIPNADQFTNQSSSVVYPKSEVKVGDTWSFEKDSQGMKMDFVYTVKSITKDKVFLDVSGKISVLAEGTINGNMEIDREKGIPLKSTIEMDMSVSGQKIKTSINVTMKEL
jgi:Family of unknown function (DUF6263)